jgi:hypothetical protein
MGNHEQAIRDLRTEARFLYNRSKSSTATSSDPRYAQFMADKRRDDLEGAQSNLRVAKWIEQNHHRVEVTPPDPGHLYQVAVRPDEHQLLDWDRPLGQQSPEVQKLVKDNNFHTSSRSGEFTGQEIYQGLVDKMGSEGASRALHDAGIPGVKFLDAGSRHLPPDHPDATRNYVVFHHSNLRVIDRDGKHFGLEPVEGDPWLAQAGATP